MKIKMLCFYAAIPAAFALHGCSKNNDDPDAPDTNCKIVTIASKAGNTTTTYNLSYNNDNKLNKVQSDDFYKLRNQFNYSGNEFIREEYSDYWNGQLVSQLHAELNSAGLPVRITIKNYFEYVPAGQPPKHQATETYTFEYNSRGEVQLQKYKREDKKSPNNPDLNFESTVTYSWSNGNIVKQEDEKGEVGEFEYYTDKPLQKGDPVDIQNVLKFGVNPIRNKNLVKTLKQGGMIININYEFEEQGKVKAALLTGTGAPDGKEDRYQYSCN